MRNIYTYEFIQDQIADELGVSRSEVNLDTNLFEELGADSLDLVNIQRWVEDTYDIEVPDTAEFPNCRAIASFICTKSAKLIQFENLPEPTAPPEPRVESHHTPGMTFSQALEILQQGRYVAREGWNGKGMYLWLLAGATIESSWCKDPHLKMLADSNGGKIEALPSIRMLTANGKILTGWLASQTDMLASDWCEVIPVIPTANE